MPSLDSVLQQKLQHLAARNLKRALPAHAPSLVSFSSNDYLGLSHHPRVIAAAQKALETYGAGARASRLISGNLPLYDELEAALAAYKKTEAACVFGSGYLTNLGVIPALVGAGDLILADRLSHACMVDAARLSGANFMRFAHNNLEHCRMLLEAHRHEHQHCLIMTETVFSMDGDRAPIDALAGLAKEFDAWLLTDGAHDLYPPSPCRGEGWGGVLISVATLSKALGSYGGYVCGSKILIDYLKSSARSVIYSTALPPATIAASLEALKIACEQPELAEKALAHARYFTSLMDMPAAASTIVPVIVKENEQALAAAKYLEECGFLVSAIRPPTVPEHTARLRFTFSALHTQAQIEQVANALKSFLQKEGI